ncbi:hypothetical protein Patl1_29746 [Pistacia atlantica]|uniref:Uncharacterized protein n=1 Tax=Pistacia atlantica TaxID=434234 RepID=A0ACC1A8E3_9ROSI|nr:hypothetical protein Patl1_29746 [Pistacia atlantica]
MLIPVIQMLRPSIPPKLLESLLFFWLRLSSLPSKMPLWLQEPKQGTVNGFLLIVLQPLKGSGWLAWMNLPHHLLAMVIVPNLVSDLLAACIKMCIS